MQGVDFSGEMELYDLITRIRTNRGCGILLISHNLHLVMAATDQVVCLNGHVCCSGKPETVRRDPQYLALFGPQAAEGLAIYTHAHDHHHDLSRSEEHPSELQSLMRLSYAVFCLIKKQYYNINIHTI